MQPGGTIELGPVVTVPDASPAIEEELPRRPPFWAALVVLAATFLALGGSLVPEPPLTATVTRLGGAGSSFAVAGDRLYLIRRPSETSSTLTAIRLPDGAELWTAPYAPTGERLIRLDTAGPVVLVSGGETTGRIRRTDAYDAATGRRLWSAPEEIVVDAEANAGYASSADPPRLRALDLATGRQLWSTAPDDRFTFTAIGGPAPVAGRIPPRAAPESETNAVGGAGGATVVGGAAGSGSGRGGRLAVFTRSGRIELRDARSGAVLRAASPLGAAVLPLTGLSVGGRLVLWYAHHGGTGIAGLDPETLDVRWRMPYDIDGGGIGRCLSLVCLSSQGDVLALDPVTGRLRWRVEEVSFVVEARGQLVALGAVPGGLGPVRSVDPETGAMVADLHGWRTGGRGDPVVTRIPIGAARTVIGLLGPAPGVLRPLGTAAEVLLSCQSGPAAIVCRTATGTLRIWAVRPGR
ncbi:PQQ-binding-like beta-propeller repeat protein [Asanoa sp. WMMD1127]|uniref:outer membrane protein assembly factor BamB family protein n=1 Tax=Asanoa sp. WMMD1127 TaxID=3016107 RepID=UPI002417D33B|nr:PQQ-binding-like beta-propeller repeat protein [Asanoa sp. WMMD1127]MDG4823795.1 PQQ-binding-like beta-propeller repeat protein [Asanoa sp. WMMD1127]